jgi:hypothetical protein
VESESKIENHQSSQSIFSAVRKDIQCEHVEFYYDATSNNDVVVMSKADLIESGKKYFVYFSNFRKKFFFLLHTPNRNFRTSVKKLFNIHLVE